MQNANLERKIDRIETLFINGDIGKLKMERCPLCNGQMDFVINKNEFITNAPIGRQYKCGITIYCLGKCGIMLSHLDGYCPGWAEEIKDWKEFSLNLYAQK